ncbi:MAG TPA: response regulator [Bryobacterales bacterium]|nr:response regulator [Bryobacterales bacterium]
MSSQRPPVVVIVDDEEMVLTSLRSFLTLETEYAVETYDSPTEAIEKIRENTVDLVISDYLMPGMNGIQFLLEIKKIRPYATRVLLTGYADKENAIKAINEVGLYQYIEKPWENEDLKLVIQNGLERRFLMERLEEKIKEVQHVQQNLQDIQAQIIKAFM